MTYFSSCSLKPSHFLIYNKNETKLLIKTTIQVKFLHIKAFKILRTKFVLS